MTIQYGSFFYFFYLFLALGLLAGLVFLLRNRTERAKIIAIQAVACLNLLQHLLKSLVYPHLWGNGFTNASTAYNVCAFLIILSPFLIFFKSQAVKDFGYVTGFLAGLLTMIFPIWFIGKPAFSWEIYRFYICHGLLMVSSALPVALGTHKISWKSWYKYGGLFVVMLFVLLLNNLLCIYLGLTGGATPENLYAALNRQNPMLIMGPRAGFEWLAELLAPITPAFLMRDGYYVPVLWHSVPLFIPLSLVALLLFSLLDWKRFRADIKHIFRKRS